MKKKNPFELKIEGPIDVNWDKIERLDYDESGKNEIYEQDPAEESRKPFNYKILSGLVFLFLSIFLVRLIDLELVRGVQYKTLATGNSLREQNIASPRGIIYDRFGVQLAYS